MNLIIVSLAIIVLIVGPFAIYKVVSRFNELKRENANLTTELADLEAEHEQRMRRSLGLADDRRELYENRINRYKSFAFRVPLGEHVRLIDTPIGHIVLIREDGYYAGTAISVFFPAGFGFNEEIARAFRAATDNRFVMDEVAKYRTTSEHSVGDGFISAGIDYHAYERGEQGYFKDSPPPDLNEMAQILKSIIVYPAGVTMNA